MLKRIIIFLIITLAAIYMLIVLVLPVAVNLFAKDFQVKVSPLLAATINAKKITIDNKFVLEKVDVVFDIKRLRLEKVNIDTLNISGEFQNKKSSNFSLPRKLPQIHIRKITYHANDLAINAENLNYADNIATVNAKISSKYLENDILAGYNGNLELKNGNIEAHGFEIALGKPKIILDGVFTDNLSITGSDLPVHDIEKTLLYYQKSKDKSKKFMENFTNYSGLVDINLKITSGGVFGDCIFKNLGANMVWFNIPVLFPKAVLHFEEKTISSDAHGILGGEKARHKILVTNFTTEEREVNGEVTAHLTDKFKYVPNLVILNSVDAKVTYNTKHKKNRVNYFLTIPPAGDLEYKDIYLGLRSKIRKFYFATFKDRNNLYVNEYSYSAFENSEFNRIVSGNALFEKQNEKFKPVYIFCETNGFAPISVVGSLGKYVQGGEFRGKLKFDFKAEKILGDFEVRNTLFKDFYVQSAHVIADEKVFVKGRGKYRNENFSCKAEAKNQFKDIYVYNMDLFLDRFILRKQTHNFNKQNRKFDISDKNINIDNWKIQVNQIKKDRIELDNIGLSGSLKENIFDFKSEEAFFADGILSAQGKYNFNNDSSCIDFLARDIDSNKAADVIFDLPDQIEGTAQAELRLATADKLDDIKACAKFSIQEGFLPRLGSTEFMLKNSRTFKAADFVNIDLSRRDAFKSDINGSFYLVNSEIKDINLTSRQKALSFLIDGEYNTASRDADLSLYGKYNKEAPKGIRILFIPLNFALKIVLRPEHTMDMYKEKLAKIPPIEAPEKNQKYFRVKFRGNLNNDPDVEFKSIQ